MNDKTIKKLPKVDLHCHLDGSVRTQTILDLAKRQNYSLPADNVEDLRKYVRVPLNCKCLGEFLERFEVFYPLLKTPYAMERVTYELLRDCSAENMRYLEIRFAPVLQKTEDFPVPEVIESVIMGVKRGEKEFKIKCRIILCLYRGTTIKDSEEVAKYALIYKSEGICGVDVAGDESRYPLKDFYKPIEICKNGGLHLTIHAGEAGGVENIKEAVKAGADRIGHGVALSNDVDFMAEIAERNIPLEVCLTTNIQTQIVESYEKHPFMKFISAGVKVTLNTDDRGVSGIDLTYEYEKALAMGLTDEKLKEIINDGVNFSFLNPVEKEELKKEFINTFG